MSISHNDKSHTFLYLVHPYSKEVRIILQGNYQHVYMSIHRTNREGFKVRKT